MRMTTGFYFFFLVKSCFYLLFIFDMQKPTTKKKLSHNLHARYVTFYWNGPKSEQTTTYKLFSQFFPCKVMKMFICYNNITLHEPTYYFDVVPNPEQSFCKSWHGGALLLVLANFSPRNGTVAKIIPPMSCHIADILLKPTLLKMVRSGLLCSAREIEGEQLRFSTLSLARPTPAALVASYMSSPFLEATLQKVGEQKNRFLYRFSPSWLVHKIKTANGRPPTATHGDKWR